MNTEQLGRGLTLAANLGVFAGLILVAVQIHRLQEMDKMGMAHEGWQERLNYLDWHLGNEVGRRWWGAIGQEQKFPC